MRPGRSEETIEIRTTDASGPIHFSDVEIVSKPEGATVPYTKADDDEEY